LAWFGVWLVLGACLRDVAPGPDLGACADLPEGTYGYGDAGIGTCIAGPAGLEFFEQDGRQWLAVSNADPYRSFRTGSILAIDWDALEPQLASGPSRTFMDEVQATAVEVYDDDDGDEEGSNPFLGRVGYLASAKALVSPGRYSEIGDYDNAPLPVLPSGAIRSALDEVWVVDTTGLVDGPVDGAMTLVQTLQVKDDPFPVAVDPAVGRVYVGNLTDHSVSVLDVSDGTDSDAPILTKVDVAPGATTTTAPLVDADLSGSLGEVTELESTAPLDTPDDDWTLTFVEQTVRLWVATPVTDEIDGVQQYSTGDTKTYIPSAFPVEEGLGEVSDPFMELGPQGVPVMWYSRGSTGAVYFALATYDGGVWYDTDVPVLGGSIFGSPSVAPFLGSPGYNLYAERRVEQGGDASIALATSVDRVDWTQRDEDVLIPPLGLSYENPFVALDGVTGTYRMWLTLRTGGERFDIALAESEDGLVWSEPEIVLPSTDTVTYAAPTVTILDGPRYGMWLARSEGTRWDTAFAWSYDGRHWTEPQTVIDGQLETYAPLRPPRPGVFVNAQPSTFGQTGGWRLAGANAGMISGLLHAGQAPTTVDDFTLAVAHGHAVSNEDIPNRRAEGRLVPTSAITIGDRQRLYVTAVDIIDAESGVGQTFGESRIAVLDRAVGGAVTEVPDGWQTLYDADEMDLLLDVGPGEQVSDPLMTEDALGYVLFYTLFDGEVARMVRATSTDGETFTREPGFVLPPSDLVTFDSLIQRPHSLEVTADGVRLWYSGEDEDDVRIGSAAAADLRAPFTREPGPVSDWRLGLGELGAFDGQGVRSPSVVTLNGEPHLYYAGFDGLEWRIGHRTFEADGALSEPRRSITTEEALPAMSGRALTYSEFGVDAPVLLGVDEVEGVARFAHAGIDATGVWRLGESSVSLEVPDVMFPRMRFPTAGDSLAFSTNRGGSGAQVIELEQSADTFSTNGEGMSSLLLDEDRGFLYVTSKLTNVISVIDVRDDSDGSFVDSNYLDLEAVLQVDTGPTPAGFRDLTLSRTRGLLYVSQRVPDALVVIDPAAIVDDGVKQLVFTGAVAVVPMQSAGEDAGATSNALIGGDGLALTADESQLLVAHFRGNALSVFDLDVGSWATETTFLQNIGENPHQVVIAPSGRYAVIANYVGEVDDDVVSSNLAIVDLDPASETYLEIVTWLVNH
jgi:DNA-binding beta-propeller fold protein YncE